MPAEILLVALLAQSPVLGEALRKWGQDDPAARDEASRDVLQRWKEWTAADLERLSRAAKSGDGEIAARAKEVEAEILFRRQFGEKTWPKVEQADKLLADLRSGSQRAKLMGWSIPGGPLFGEPPQVEPLVKLGPDIEPFVRRALTDPGIRGEVALILAQTGGVDSLPALIDAIPPADGTVYTCVVYALWCLTGQSIGIHSRMEVGWSADVPQQWRRWYEERKDHLFGTGGTVSVDVEAQALGKTSKAYRKDHPWVRYDEIREPKQGPEYESRLREYCVSFLLRSLWRHGRYDDDALLVLAEVDDPRSLESIRLVARETVKAKSEPVWVAWALSEKAPQTIPDLERLLTEVNEDQKRYIRIPLVWAKLRERIGRGRLGRRVEADQAKILLDCLEDRKAIPALLDALRAPAADGGVFEVAGYVKDKGVTAALRTIQQEQSGDPIRRLQAATALARSGDPASLDTLREMLRHEKPYVRLAAAEGLWRASNREGFKILLTLLDLRPIEDGRTGSPGIRTFIPPHRTSSLHVIRRSCELLGEMGDPAAIDPLKRVLKENLNGILGMPAGPKGTGWYSRPDAVALARLGDFSGMEILFASIRNGDPLLAAGDRSMPGDLVEIGLKRFAPHLVPLLGDTGFERRSLYAARAIVTLLDRGR